MTARSNPTPTESQLAELKHEIAELRRELAELKQALGVRPGFELREKAVA
jgi:hypothetical protein